MRSIGIVSLSASHFGARGALIGTGSTRLITRVFSGSIACGTAKSGSCRLTA